MDTVPETASNNSAANNSANNDRGAVVVAVVVDDDFITGVDNFRGPRAGRPRRHYAAALAVRSSAAARIVHVHPIYVRRCRLHTHKKVHMLIIYLFSYTDNSITVFCYYIYIL